MKKITLGLALILVSTVVVADDEPQRFSVGIGIGSAFSGLGANAAMLSKTDMQYVSVGCVEHRIFSGSSCGFGIGWISTDLFNNDSDNHGLGIYASIVDAEKTPGSSRDQRSLFPNDHYSDVYGVGLSYTYFRNGISQLGWHYGISIHATNAEFDDKVGGFLQIGYQF